MKTTKLFLTLGASLLAAGSSWSAEIWLRAAPTTITLPGRVDPVTMWGFAKDTTGTSMDGVVTVPGPQLTVAPGDTTLIIHLINYLPEPVSIVIPGQPGAALGDPAKFTDATGRKRAKSLTHEAAAFDGTTPGTAAFTWNNVQPGTYLYYSGTHSAVQVQMGLYGALTKTFSEAANNRFAYQGVNYDKEVTLLFSEVDVNVHDAVATGNFHPQADPLDPDPNVMSSTTDSRAQYFLINGQPYTPGRSPIYLTGGQGQRALFRFLNAGLDSHVPILNGINDLQLLAEDGQRYLDNKTVYSVNLPSLKTTDALLVNIPYGTFALYDRRLGLANGASGAGGMLAYVTVPFSQSGGAITIGASGNATPYGTGNAQLTVAGGDGFPIAKVMVSLNGFSHARPQDVDVMLVHTLGGVSQKVLLMSDVGGSTAVLSTAPVTLTFDDAAAGTVSATLATGTYRPTDVTDGSGNDTFTGVPAGTVFSSLSAFNGVSSAGQWRLFVRDDSAGSAGAISSWTLTLHPAWQP